MEDKSYLLETLKKIKAYENIEPKFFKEIEELIVNVLKIKDSPPAYEIFDGNAWFGEIFNSANEAILIHNATDGTIVNLNPAALKIYGYARKIEMLNLKILDLSSNQDIYVEDNIQKYIHMTISEGPQSFIWQGKRKNGEVFWCEVSLKSTKIGGNDQILAIVVDIDHRKKTEDALFESEKFLKETQEIARLGTYVLDINTGIWRCSNVLDEIFGIEKLQEKSVELWIKLLHPSCANEMTSYFIEDVIGKGISFDKEYQIIRANDNEERWVHGMGKLIKNADGKPIQMIGTIRDVTERKRYEHILKQTEIRQSAMIANISEVITIVDRNGIITYKSPNIEKWFGWKPEEVISKYSIDFFHPDDAENVLKSFAEISLEENSLIQAETRYLCKNGEYRWIEFTATNLFNNPDIKGILINYHDITARKEAGKALLAEQRFSKTILDSLPGIFYFYSYPELQLKMWNKNHEVLLGYSQEEIKNCQIMDFHLPENKPAVQAAVDFVMQHGINSIEAYLMAKDGSKIPFLLTGVRFEVQDKLYLMGVGIDITEQKKQELLLRKKNEEIEVQNEEYLQLNEELIQTNDELLVAKTMAEESDRLKTAFLQNMSHEIRTPMNAIMGFSELMASAYNDKEKLDYFAQIINRRCNDLLAIINDILDIAKIESGQLTVYHEKCDIPTLFAELDTFYREYQKRLRKEHLHFELVISKELQECSIVSDIVKLKQILINLISNAFKYTEDGSIICSSKLENKKIIFSVADTGIGIPKEKHQFVFERFVQAHHQRQVVGGTGLGLAIVKGLLNLMNGRIWLDSEPGKRSTFYFEIPFAPYVSKEIDYENEEISLPNVDFSGKTLLIVEDEVYNFVYLEEVLAPYNIQIINAADGKEALRKIKNSKFDLVLMDIRLPDMSGYDVTKEIKKISPLLKIIALTAYAAPEDRIKAIQSGCIDYLSKPVKKDDLVAMISKYLKV